VKKYAISEVFYTLQGEGSNAGTPAMFIRFAGCNLWRNTPETRADDAARNGADCPLWCDTDFQAREHLTLEDLVSTVNHHFHGQTGGRRLPLIVLTGGEPLLQFSEELYLALKQGTAAESISIETNGTRPLPESEILLRALRRRELQITCSPKVRPEKLQLQYLTELKVVFPDYDPDIYWHHFRKLYADRADMDSGNHFGDVRLFVQPKASVFPSDIGRSLIHAQTQSQAAAWVMRNPAWRLSLQTHKILGVP